MFLRRDFDEWMAGTSIPGWIQALLSCGKCGTAHAAFWLTVATWPAWHCWPSLWPTAASGLLVWAGSAGLSLKLRSK